MRIKFLAPAFLAAVAAIALLSSPMSAASQRKHTEQNAIVTAYTDSATPATGLTETDFVIREDGLAREVIRVGIAPPPSHVMLLLDDSQAADRSIQFLRTAAPAFVAAMATLTPAPLISVMTFGERPTMRADFSAKPEAATAAAGKLFSTPGTGSYLLQALMDASKNLVKRNATSPLIVAYAAEAGPEFSSERREQVAAAMDRANAALWAIVLQGRTAGMDQTPEGLERNAVLHDVVRGTGGFTRTIVSEQSVGPAFETVAALIKSRYLVTYSRPDQLIPPKNVEITAKRDDVRVIASRKAK